MKWQICRLPGQATFLLVLGQYNNQHITFSLSYEFFIASRPMKHLFSCLCRLYNRAVRVTCGLRKYDHVSDCRLGLRWLPLDLLIQHRALNVMYRYYTDDNCILLNPPVVFGHQHTYTTRAPSHFANIFRCHLSFTKKFFRSSATSWWNSLPNQLLTVPCYLLLHFLEDYTATFCP